MPTVNPKIFLITGVCSGLGRAFAERALNVGHRAIGTVRKEEDADRFAALAADRAHPLILDVTDYAATPGAVAEAERRAGPVEVLVDNAGYAHEGALEESSTDDLQRQFAANVYGPVAFMKAVLPGMHKRHCGHIITVISMVAYAQHRRRRGRLTASDRPRCCFGGGRPFGKSVSAGLYRSR